MQQHTRLTVLIGCVLALTLSACGGSDDADPATATSATATEEPSSSEEPTDEPSEEPSDASSEPVVTIAEPDVDPATVCGEEEFGIVVTFPSDGDTIEDGSPVEGCGSTFEATYEWEVVFADGTTDAGFGTMTCGSGCIGSFSQSLELTSTGPATLTVFESSAEDGSRINVVEVAVDVA